MALQIQIIGDSPRAHRILQQLLALKEFEITTVPEQKRTAIAARRGEESPLPDVEGRRTSRAMLQEHSTSGEIEGFPVVTLRLQRSGLA